MAVIDFHTHILPEMDDGSRNAETSVKMLQMSAEHGTDLMVATPHFYGTRDRIESFLERRTESFRKLTEGLSTSENAAVMEAAASSERSIDSEAAVSSEHSIDSEAAASSEHSIDLETAAASVQCAAYIPQIRLGAEVAWFDGISRADKIELLTIEGTNLLLLELPFEAWKASMFDELKVLSKRHHIVLAHLERYLRIPGNSRRLEELMELPLQAQVNAGTLLNWRTRGSAVKLFRKGQAHFLGSDCHGAHHRQPNLGSGRAVLEKKLGTDFMKKMDEAGTKLLLG